MKLALLRQPGAEKRETGCYAGAMDRMTSMTGVRWLLRGKAFLGGAAKGRRGLLGEG